MIGEVGGADKGLKVVASHRCWFPKGAWRWSTTEIAEMAREVGYEGVEWLPTWRFCWEMRQYGKLLASEGMVASGHRDWRFDRVMEAKLKGKPEWWYQLKNKEDWLFPPSGICLRALRGFQNRYRVPVSVGWFGDTGNFSPVMLELWGAKQGVGYEELLEWLDGDKRGRGVVLDTAKLSSWLESCGVEGKRRQVVRRLLPHVFEVHFRLKKSGREGAMDAGWGKLGNDTMDNWRLIRELGYKGRVVVEAGWPDMDERVFGVFGQARGRFREIHRELVKMVKETK
jgi:hypothetical protein